jgi:hypothetical protein
MGVIQIVFLGLLLLCQVHLGLESNIEEPTETAYSALAFALSAATSPAPEQAHSPAHHGTCELLPLSLSLLSASSLDPRDRLLPIAKNDQPLIGIRLIDPPPRLTSL